MDTVFLGEKVQTQTAGTFHGVSGMLSGLNGMSYTGYEIHMGRSQEKLPPLQGKGNVYGSYIHGIFDAPGVSDAILKSICTQKRLDFGSLGRFDPQEYKNRQYNLLADAVRGGLDMELVYHIINREV